MTRSFLILIALVAITSFFYRPAAGQFTITIPKIKIPKVPKTDAPQAPTIEDPISTVSDQSSNSASNSDDDSGDVMGRPIPGARITFSNKPDGSDPKTTFSSSEYIYGHLDLGGKTMYEAFGWKVLGTREFYYVNYDLRVRKPGAKGSSNWATQSPALVTKEDAQKTYWNFDVLPDPSLASTRIAALADDLSNYNGVAGVYPKAYDLEMARITFPQNGTYTIDVAIFGNSYDDWGKPTNKWDEYPTVTGSAAFQFSGSDGQRIASGYKKARDTLESVKNKREMYHTMPDWWAKAWTGSEPKLASARLVPMIKGFMGRWNLTYMKHMIWNFSGPVWVVQKNELGIPRYRNVNTTIYVIYKDPEDNECKVGGLTMQEDYSGAGTYGEPYLAGISDVKYIDCGAVR